MEARRARDPIAIVERRLAERGLIDRQGVERTRAELRSAVADGFAQALAAPRPEERAIYEYVYATGGRQPA